MNLETHQLPQKGPSTITNERQELLKRFLDRGEIAIFDKKRLRPVTAKELGSILRSFATADLHLLFMRCEEADSFGKLFWYLVRHQNEQHKSKATQ